ncbi:hypothetical protein J3A83DRAFT_4359967 [Scleroderma citrinum]
MHLPHSVFSQCQLDLLTWILQIDDVQDVPSVRTLKTLEDGLQKICGINTLSFTGAFGHKYFMNSLSDIIAQEMANPHLKEMDPAQLTPMVQLHNQDFYIFEPTLLTSGQCIRSTIFIFCAHPTLHHLLRC